jgi:uncharacterized protein YggE
MIDMAIESGMNRVDSINFDIDHSERKLMEEELMVSALENAR